MLDEIFQKPKPVLGVVQLLPLPGSPHWNGQLQAVYTRAEQEATALASGGADGILIENFYDAPYRRGRIDPAGAVAMALVAQRIRQFTDLPIGISVLQNDPETALAIALNVQAAFIRVPVLVGTMITESGMVEGKLNELVDTRNRLKMSHAPAIFADITMNHILPAPQRETPWKAPFAYLAQVTAAVKKHGFADALVLSDHEVTPENLAQLRATTELPMLVAGQLLPDRVEAYYSVADGVLLSASIRKNPVAGMDPRTAVDVTKVEEILLRLAPHRGGLPASPFPR